MAIGFIPTTDRDGLVDMRSQDTSMSGLSQNTEATLPQAIASDARTLSSGIAACSDLDHVVVQELGSNRLLRECLGLPKTTYRRMDLMLNIANWRGAKVIENRTPLHPDIRTVVRILPICHDYVDGSLDEIEAQSEGLKDRASEAEVVR
jgi:hypothetical protein